MSTGFLARLAVTLRKHLGESTVSVFTLRNVYIMAYTEIINTYGVEEGLKRIFRWGYEMGHEFLLRTKRDLERYKVSPKSTEFIGWTAWYIFAGNKPITSVREVEIDGYKVIELKVRDPNCPFCSGISAKNPVCIFNGGTYEAAGCTFTKLFDPRFSAIARETKCKAMGDEYCEITYLTYPKKLGFNKVVKHFGYMFKYIDAEYSRQLYREIFGEDKDKLPE